MKRGLIDGLYDRAHVIYEVPYESSVVDPTIVSVHKQKVWDRYRFAELIVRECAKALDDKLANPNGASMAYCDGSDLLEHFGVEE